MPEKITIENLYIDDSNHPENYQGPSIFSDFNSQMTDDSYEEVFPYVKTKEVILRNVRSASGMKLRMSKNPFMFKDVKVTGDGVKNFEAQHFLEIDNDTLHLKLDLSRGGAIAYLSKAGSKRNLINIHDEGRYVQQSYYAGRSINRQKDGQNPGWSPWGWNPIQVGDSYNNRAEVLISKKEGNTVYVKCIPMLWDMNNSPAEATMEQWTTLEGNFLKVKNRLICKRTDTIYDDVKTNDQELPAVYPISSLDKLYCYLGDSPFTGAPLENLEVEHLEDGFWGRYMDDKITENWMAFVDENKFGMAVYTPICNNFLAGMSGKPGGEAESGSTSYIAPVKSIKMHKNTVLEYTYYLLIGDLNEMRSTIYDLKTGNN